jgi:NADH-quinone oxidoreductase subunit C
VNSTELFDLLRPLVSGVALEPAPATDQKTIGMPADSIGEVCRVLREHPSLGFVFLADITAVDWWPREPRFEVVYHLASMTDRLRLKVWVPGTRLPTVKSVWAGANWLEREVWDLFGIVFDGHDDLRRLLMPEDWEGHPLRKDYPVQIRLKPRSTEPLQMSEDEFRANLAADRAARGGGHGSGS